MCDPVTASVLAASLAASAGGNYLQQKNNNDSATAQVNARNAVAAQGVQQQQPNIQAGQDQLNQTIQKLSGPQQQQDIGNVIAGRTAAINNNTTPATGTTNPSGNISDAPAVVQSDLAAKMSKAAAFANQQGGALGAMGATGDQFANNASTLNLSGTNLDNLATKSKQEAGVNRIQQNSAYANARKNPDMFGQLLSTAGNLGTMAASGGAFAPAGAASTTAAAAQGAVNGSQAATGAPWVWNGDYYGAGV